MVRISLLASACFALAAQSVGAAPCSDHDPKPPVKPGNGPGGYPVQNQSGIAMPGDFKKYLAQYQKNVKASLPKTGKCTEKTIGIRKSWDDLDDPTRLDYIRAVHCLANKPARNSKALVPGAVNRLDDLTYIHINQTNIVHNDGYFLAFHRLLLQQFETAMREECGYKGFLPYWDNARFSEDQLASKLWDSSATSFGGDGEFLPNDHGPYTVIIPGLVGNNFTIVKSAGTGGGCITSGPFKNLTISLGPVVKPVIDPSNKFGYKPNPRCLSRNFDRTSSQGILTWANATTIVSSPTIADLRNNIEKYWHRNSHNFIGKEAADPFSPTNDPAFYLLHAQIDRLWGIWQGQDLKNRTFAIDGTRTFFGIPLDYAPDVKPSPAQIDDVIDLGLGFKPKVKEGMPMTEGKLCFLYD